MKRVVINGKAALYTIAEHEFMRAVVAAGSYGEAAFLHELHGTFNGRFVGLEDDEPKHEQGALL